MDTWACDIKWAPDNAWEHDGKLSAGQVLAMMAGRNEPVRVLDAIVARIDAQATAEGQDAALRAFGPVALNIWTPSAGCAGQAIFLRLARLGSGKAVEILGHAVDSDEVRTALIEILRAELHAWAQLTNPRKRARRSYDDRSGWFREVTFALSRAAVDHADARAALLEGLAEPGFSCSVLSAAAITDEDTRRALISLATDESNAYRYKAVNALAEASAVDSDARKIVLKDVSAGLLAACHDICFLPWLTDLPETRLLLTNRFLLDESRIWAEFRASQKGMLGGVHHENILALMSRAAVHADTREALLSLAQSGSPGAVFVLAACAVTDRQTRCELQELVRSGPEEVVRAWAVATVVTRERPHSAELAGRVRALGVALTDDEMIRDRLFRLGSYPAVRLLLHWCEENVSDVSRQLLGRVLDDHQSKLRPADLDAVAVKYPLAREVLLGELATFRGRRKQSEEEHHNEYGNVVILPESAFPSEWERNDCRGGRNLFYLAWALAGAAVVDGTTRDALIELVQNGWKDAIPGLGRAAVEHEGVRFVLETAAMTGDSDAMTALIAAASVHESSFWVLLAWAKHGSMTAINELTEIIETVNPTLRLAAARRFFEYATSSNPEYDERLVELFEATVSDLWS